MGKYMIREEKMETSERANTDSNRGTGDMAVPPPFDAERLDELMEQAGIDALVVTSKHNVQYLLGGYRFFFFDHFDAIGVSRYLPLLVYAKGHPERSTYIGHPMENYERELGQFWVPTFHPSANTSTDGMKRAIELVSALGPKAKRIGVERAFLPADAESVLRAGLPQAEFVEAQFPLERLRAVKTARELDHLRVASDLVVDSMLAVIAGHGPGATKNELVEALRREEVNRGLNFEYCLITAGTSRNRAPSNQIWREGDILSLDSGGNYKGYIGDLCRMGILGDPDVELEDLLGEVDAIQQAARRPIRHGARGGDVFASTEELVRKSPYSNSLEFVAHGMGLISHEAPRLTDRGPVPYPAYDADLPLEKGMVLSIETTLLHPRRGFVKLEDTVAVTEQGCEAFGDRGRGWNRGGRGAISAAA
jgi:Xaa-Pro aminopeptidase